MILVDGTNWNPVGFGPWDLKSQSEVVPSSCSRQDEENSPQRHRTEEVVEEALVLVPLLVWSPPWTGRKLLLVSEGYRKKKTRIDLEANDQSHSLEEAWEDRSWPQQRRSRTEKHRRVGRVGCERCVPAGVRLEHRAWSCS